MTRSDVPNFEACFHALTGHRPMRWQCRLFLRLLANDLPETCDIPTGLGKTSVLPIWLLALARQAETSDLRLPRRLVYIVNRRTVVDQATDVVERLRSRLVEPESGDWQEHAATLSAIAGALRGLSTSYGPPLAVSTLRGELADNEEWKADPARPAIVIGTIDMIGSKLLFSGYGDGRYGRAHHAGLIGQDVLIVHDEAHLTPAFTDLLRGVAEEQRREIRGNGEGNAIVRPIRVLELSATSRGTSSMPFTLENEDQNDCVVQDRVTASKRLRLHPASADKLIEEIVKVASKHKDVQAKVLIYVRSPEHTQQIAATLEGALGTGGSERIALLTGTIRGHERDQLVRQPPTSAAAQVIRHFIDGTRPERSVYVISTSAGEVGIDLDADHMVCDLTTLDAMIQRLGRVNRRGGKDRRACVDVVGDAPAKDNPSELDKAIAATFETLKRWGNEQTDGIDVSPGSLRRLIEALNDEQRAEEFSPTPEAPPLTDILLDGWSLTSVEEMPGVPEVAAFLHGLAEGEPPDTYVAWRKEITLLKELEPTREGLSEEGYRKAQSEFEEKLGNWFRACRIEARERLRDRTERVRNALEELLRKQRKGKNVDDMDFPVVLLDERGRAKWSALSEIVQKQDGGRLKYRTVVLPVEAGGLNEKGMLDPDAVTPAEGFSLDVAEMGEVPEGWQRWLCRGSENVERYERLDTGEIFDDPPHGLREKARVSLKETSEGEESVESLDLVLFVSAARSALEDPETTSARQTLKDHSRAVADRMSAIAKRLRLPEPIQQALVMAAQWHDNGKDRPVWQRYARNPGGSDVLAKAPRYLHPRALGGYRHEFGSLLDAMSDAAIQQHPERDLILHLIAAHHGWARPHFEPRSFDHTRTTAENEEAAVEAMRRFGRLQQRFGRWGLAWLESLVRCADIAASKEAHRLEDLGGVLVRALCRHRGIEGGCRPNGFRDRDSGGSGVKVPDPSFSIPVDVTNPGQFFACCGLLELAHRLWPGAEGWFYTDPLVFNIRAAGTPCSLEHILACLAKAKLEGDLSQEERNELDELEEKKRSLLKQRQQLSEEDEERRKTLGQRQREGAVRFGDPLNLRVGWWEEDGDDIPKTFAGRQEVLRMVLAMRTVVHHAVSESHPLDYRDLLKDEKGKKVEPFYFDAQRFAHSLDAGFSLDKQEKTIGASAAPLAEMLALIGLQRFRPRATDVDKWTFEYFTWNQPLGVAPAAAAACGAAPIAGRRGFRFRLQFRDDQKRYKAFGFASQIGGNT